MTDPRIEQVCRALCKAHGINPDDPQLRPDVSLMPVPMWEAYIIPAKEHIAAFDVLFGQNDITSLLANTPFFKVQP